jgi:hypothetical protein
MHFRRFVCFTLGLWVGGGLLMVWLGASWSRGADRLLVRPGGAVSAQVRNLGYDQTRALLRAEASEQKRWEFETWETIQLVGGTLLFLYLLLGTTERKLGLGLVLAMVLTAAVQRFLITPELAAIENNLLLLSPEAEAARRDTFWMLHSGYYGLETLKLGLGLVLVGKYIASGRRSRLDDSGDDLDLVDKPNYRHVNG